VLGPVTKSRSFRRKKRLFSRSKKIGCRFVAAIVDVIVFPGPKCYFAAWHTVSPKQQPATYFVLVRTSAPVFRAGSSHTV